MKRKHKATIRSDKEAQHIIDLRNKGYSVIEIAERKHVTRQAIYRYIWRHERKLKEQELAEQANESRS
ncbi:helix-turn-helix domain-containing protein [Clostridium sp.]|uniref:helix-turn-helix domain-containing protein n=1 Tax=Clostridium sp. TaxID=1506 RepID=UPI001A5AA24C|nr:helix-turn-helix domain-containing protein [Clostridium sp.]MBK5234085.1 helix-turn-helix domain-containing protein [Clostridium sp.]